MFEITREALDAANAIVWPGDDDAAPSIADEDDLKVALEAAAPHIVSPALADLRERMAKTDRELKDMAASTDDSTGPGLNRALRLRAKADGVRLALSYLDEMARGL